MTESRPMIGPLSMGTGPAYADQPAPPSVKSDAVAMWTVRLSHTGKGKIQFLSADGITTAVVHQGRFSSEIFHGISALNNGVHRQFVSAGWSVSTPRVVNGLPNYRKTRHYLVFEKPGRGRTILRFIHVTVPQTLLLALKDTFSKEIVNGQPSGEQVPVEAERGSQSEPGSGGSDWDSAGLGQEDEHDHEQSGWEHEEEGELIDDGHES